MTIVYKYHCEPETPDDEVLLIQQLRLASEYRRELARVENLRRALRRSASWVESDLTAELLAAGSAEQRRVRGEFSRRGLAWGTYQHVEEAAAASQRSTPLGDDVERGVSFGFGCVAVHLQPARALRPDDAWIRVEPGLVRRDSWELLPGGGFARRTSELDRSGRVRPARHRRVLLRVGTTPDRRPLFASVLVLMDREIPEDGRVSWALVKRRRVGPRSRYSLHVVVATVASCPASTPGVDRADAVGIDVGWRKVSGGTRVVTWWGTDGKQGEIVLPERVTGTDDVADRLRGIRADNRNRLAAGLRAWTDAFPGRGPIRCQQIPSLATSDPSRDGC